MLWVMTRRPSRAGILAAALTITLLSGCTGASPSSDPTPNGATRPTLTASPSSTAEATSVAVVTTCDTVLTADGYAKLASDGLAPIETTYLHRLADQLSDAGGITCSWGKPQTDIVLTVVQLNFPGADHGIWATNLADAGYVESNDPVPGAHTGPVDPGTGVPTVAVVADDRITFLSTRAFAEMIAPA